MLLCGTLRRAARRRRRTCSPRRRRRGLHGRLLHREDGLLGLRLLHEELLLLHGDHHLLPARDAASSRARRCRVYGVRSRRAPDAIDATLSPQRHPLDGDR